MHTPQRHKRRAFSSFELLSVVAIIGVIAAIGFAALAKIRPAASKTQVQTDVSQLNTAIRMYLSSGGDLTDVTNAGTVLARLKTQMSAATAETYVGFTGSTIDQRLSIVLVAPTEKGPRAIYDSTEKRFKVTTDQIDGMRFELDESGSGHMVAAAEQRDSGAVSYSSDSAWIWDYQDTSKSAPLDATVITRVPTTGVIPVTLDPIDGIDTPTEGALRKLLPPIFSLPSGTYSPSDYPMSLEIINPNEAGQIIYGMISDSDWEWTPYNSPLIITPETQIVAYVESWRPDVYHNSNSNTASYTWNARLSTPSIDVSDDSIPEDEQVEISISHSNQESYYTSAGINLPDNPFTLEYRLVPTGEGTETSWTTYDDTFEVTGEEFPDGFTIYSRVVSAVATIEDSNTTSEEITTYDPDNPPHQEVEFTTYNLELTYGDTFNIRDYVRVKDDHSAPIDWSKVYFTYTEAGANNPPTPNGWNLAAFNNGQPVTVTNADAAEGTGNSGNGRYIIYLARDNKPDYDDHMSIRITGDSDDGDGGVLPSLLPPVFSPWGGYFSSASFPLSITLTDPNPAGAGRIMYSLGDSVQVYTGPFSVLPGTEVSAFVESLDAEQMANSSVQKQIYHESSNPSGTWVWVSNPSINAMSGSTNIAIGFQNTSHINWEIQYKLIPTVPGEGTETPWTTYNGSFAIGAPQFPRGFEVVSKLVPSESSYSEVAGSSKIVTTYYPLSSPTIHSSVDAITDKNPTAVITMTNPNPSGSSNIEYQIRNLNNVVLSDWAQYNNAFSVTKAAYPDGIKIVAKAIGTEDYYQESNLTSKTISAKFFGIDLTWNTIFILDTSGSMVTNDRLSRLQSRVLTVLEEFTDNDSFAIIDYDSSATVLSSWGPATAGKKQAAISAVNGMEADGATNYHGALQSALGLNADGATQVIFLSDGLPFDPDAIDPEATDGILALVQEIVSGSIERLDTIALGIESNILDQMAEIGGGNSELIND